MQPAHQLKIKAIWGLVSCPRTLSHAEWRRWGLSRQLIQIEKTVVSLQCHGSVYSHTSSPHRDGLTVESTVCVAAAAPAAAE